MSRGARRRRLWREYRAELRFQWDHALACPRCYTALKAGSLALACSANRERLTEFVRAAAYWRSVRQHAPAGTSG